MVTRRLFTVSLLFVCLVLTSFYLCGCGFGSSSGGTVENPVAPIDSNPTGLSLKNTTFTLELPPGANPGDLKLTSIVGEVGILNNSGSVSIPSSDTYPLVVATDKNENPVLLSIGGSSLSGLGNLTPSIRANLSSSKINPETTAVSLLVCCPLFAGIDSETKQQTISNAINTNEFRELVLLITNHLASGAYDYLVPGKKEDVYDKALAAISKVWVSPTSSLRFRQYPSIFSKAPALKENHDGTIALTNDSYIYYEAESDVDAFQTSGKWVFIPGKDAWFSWKLWPPSVGITDPKTVTFLVNPSQAILKITKSHILNGLRAFLILLKLFECESFANSLNFTVDDLKFLREIYSDLLFLGEYGQALQNVKTVADGWKIVVDLINHKKKEIIAVAAKILAYKFPFAGFNISVIKEIFVKAISNAVGGWATAIVKSAQFANEGIPFFKDWFWGESGYEAIINKTAPPVTPQITSVSPNPVEGRNSAQPFVINGQGFNGCTVTLRDGRTGQDYPDRVIKARTDTTLTIEPDFTDTPAVWTVIVKNGTLKAEYAFLVTAPGVSGIKENTVPSANAFRLPIGDNGSADVGENINLLVTDQFWNTFSYPKISFNWGGMANNRWWVATAFNKDRWLNNGWAEPSNSDASLYSATYLSFHPGEDWNLDGDDYGLPVHAIADGAVLYNGTTEKNYGNVVILAHKLSTGEIITSFYAHLENLQGHQIGQIISKGEKIGNIGKSGTTASHLHFEIRKGSMLINESQNGYMTLKYPVTMWPDTISPNDNGQQFIVDNYYNPSTFLKATVPSNAGTVSGTVKDAVNNNPLGEVTIKIFNQGGSLVTSATTNSTGKYSFSIQANSGYRLEFSKAGYLGANYEGISIEIGETKALETILQIDNQHAGTGIVSGKVTDSTTGNGLSEVTLKLRKGVNVNSGTVVNTTTTDTSGVYQINDLEAGQYTVEVIKANYITGYFTVTSIGGLTTGNQNGSISPENLTGEGIRVQLTWGANPSDLDSHLTGPDGSGGRFHIYFSNKSFSFGGEKIADLDVDDTNSYGPETVTLYKQISGVYRYSIHDYSNRSAAESSVLSNSGAKITVFRGNQIINTFNVPNSPGTLWTVFELNGNTITPINTMAYESNEGNIKTSILSAAGITEKGNDGYLMVDLPSKLPK